MGFFERFRKRELDQEETAVVEPPVSDALLRAFLNQETITREKALTLPSVSGAVDFISNSVASMPIRLYKIRAGRVEEVVDDTRVKLLNGDTGDTLNAYQMKKALVEDYLLGKGGYMYIQRTRNEVTGLYYVDESNISIQDNNKPIYKDYVILVQGRQYQPWEFVKLLRNTKNGAEGKGVTEEVSKALETAYQMLLYQLQLVKTGGSKRGFVKSQRKLGQEEINVLKKSWRELYSDGEERVVVLNNGLEFQEASSSSVEMQLNESKRTLQDEINGIFHIHPESFDLTYKEAIYPIVKAFEAALNRDLLLEKEKKNCFYALDVKEIIKATLSERYAAYKLAKETGFMTLNEIRQAENMSYVEGLDVVNVGLGAVLYDTNLHRYYTPNTDTFSQQTGSDDGSMEAEIEAKLADMEELQKAQAEAKVAKDTNMAVRFNPNHDGKNGRFTTGHSGSPGAKEDGEKITGGDYEEVLKELPFRDVLEKEFGSINSDKIILTKRQAEHIQEGHPEDIELFNKNKKDILGRPDAIVRDSKRERTVFFLKSLEGGNCKTVVRLSIGKGEKERDNSIITFHRISKKRYEKLLLSDKVLYKGE